MERSHVIYQEQLFGWFHLVVQWNCEFCKTCLFDSEIQFHLHQGMESKKPIFIKFIQFLQFIVWFLFLNISTISDYSNDLEYFARFRGFISSSQLKVPLVKSNITLSSVLVLNQIILKFLKICHWNIGFYNNKERSLIDYAVSRLYICYLNLEQKKFVKMGHSHQWLYFRWCTMHQSAQQHCVSWG